MSIRKHNKVAEARKRNVNWTYFPFLALISAAAFVAADFARAVGLRTHFGSIAFRILKTVHAVPTAWPADLRPWLVASAACSPYLQHKTSSVQLYYANFCLFNHWSPPPSIAYWQHKLKLLNVSITNKYQYRT